MPMERQSCGPSGTPSLSTFSKATPPGRLNVNQIDRGAVITRRRSRNTEMTDANASASPPSSFPKN